MRLAELISGLPVTWHSPASAPPLDLDVRGVAHDSRRIERGDVFVTWPGGKHDGRTFAAQALERGAIAVIAAGPPLGETPLPWLTAAEPRKLLGPLASRLYRHPDHELTLVGVTGTNGKTTTTTLICAMLNRAGRPAGFLGTVGYRFEGREFASGRTTPEASDFFSILRAMRTAGADAVAMEVSSHALVQERVACAQFDLAVFTNLTRDHFDFHPTIESYFEAKRRLFDQLKPNARAVLNADDPYGRRLIHELAAQVRTTTYGTNGEVSLLGVTLGSSGSRGEIRTPRGRLAFETSLLGRYNLDNVLAAVASGEALGLPHAAMAAAIAEIKPLPGRLEPILAGQPFPIYVDYAHTDAALSAAIKAAKEIGGGRVIVVFGCGGDRDPGKRPLMGRVAGELADVAILTSDNPRSEDPLAIIAAAETGLAASGAKGYEVIPDRRQAIRRAIELGCPGTAVLVAGKGHERVQIFADRELPFSDIEEIHTALEERHGCATHR